MHLCRQLSRFPLGTLSLSRPSLMRISSKIACTRLSLLISDTWSLSLALQVVRLPRGFLDPHSVQQLFVLVLSLSENGIVSTDTLHRFMLNVKRNVVE